MCDFIFDLPLLVTGPALIVLFLLYSWGGLLLARRLIHPRLTIHPEDAHFIGTMVHTVAVFYGLTVALITIAVWETYSDVSHLVSNEATAIASLWRDLGGYPEPVREQTRGELRGYTEYVIREAWPMQRKGQVPGGGVERMDRFQADLFSFQPATDAEKILHAETLRAYNQLISARRLRLDAVGTSLPGVLWTVVLAGALICLAASFCFRVDDVRLHTVLVALLASFVGLVIFVILALDHPFRGDLGIGPEPYRLVYDQLMK
jgi:hypothetical protein